MPILGNTDWDTRNSQTIRPHRLVQMGTFLAPASFQHDGNREQVKIRNPRSFHLLRQGLEVVIEHEMGKQQLQLVRGEEPTRTTELSAQT
jgi:hypothetical protein